MSERGNRGWRTRWWPALGALLLLVRLASADELVVSPSVEGQASPPDCALAFDLFAALVMTSCALQPVSAVVPEIDTALARLVALQLVPVTRLTPTQIVFCPLFNATGVVPAPHLIVLDAGLRRLSADGLAEIIVHELVHVQQFERLGPVGFKCAYTRAMAACGGCQDRRHPLERAAYDAQDFARAKLLATPR